MSSYQARASSNEATAGNPRDSLQNASRSGAFSRSTTGIPGLVNNGSYPVNPILAAVRQQEARQLMIEAAANASSAMFPGGHVPSHEAYLYEQALLAQRGRQHSAHYGDGYHPMNSFPTQLPPPLPPPSAPIAPKPLVMTTDTSKRTKPISRDEDKEPSDYKKKSKYEPYFDGSTMPDEESYSDEDNKIVTRRGEEPLEGAITTAQMSTKERLNEAFPKKLYRMIDDAKKNGQEDIISFFSHGRAFAIHRPKAFIEEIMPKYMSTSRMTSFQRQLNLYNFKRIIEGKDRGGYYHEFFLQGRKGLLKKIKRKKPAPPKCSSRALDQAARISNAILSSGKYAPTYSRNLGLVADSMVHQQQPSRLDYWRQQQQMAGPSQDESYANAMRMRDFGSSTGGVPSSPVASRPPQDRLYPQGIETEASP